MSSEPPVADALTVDVEEWFHILDYEDAPDPARWDGLESRVALGTDRILEILAGARVRGTFFFLGWVAERHPELARRVAAAGHEIATHGHRHRLVYKGTPADFREDARRARGVLEDQAGVPVQGYRAAGFSITADTPWAFDVLAEEGFRYDSSVFPAKRAHGGLEVARRRPFRISGPAGGSLWEFPIVPWDLGPLRLPFAGGGYFRLWPLALVRAGARAQHRDGVPVTWYLHPREVDPAQPRLALPLARRFKYYVGLRGAARKLERLLDGECDFRTLAEQVERYERAAGGPPHDPPLRLSAPSGA
jgi:polysaccharide deacetylase family protein (PEP-CTERM system associated)